MVPVLVSFTGTAEVMVAKREYVYPREDAEPVHASAVRTALAYVTPEGFTIDRIDDWEMLPT